MTCLGVKSSIKTHILDYSKNYTIYILVENDRQDVIARVVREPVVIKNNVMVSLFPFGRIGSHLLPFRIHMGPLNKVGGSEPFGR